MPSPVSADEVVRLAVKLWGEPTERLRGGQELRFGRHGSKSVKPFAGVFHDHEANEGGGVKELYALAGEAMPTRSAVLAVYDYRNASGALVYQVVKRYPHKFLQRRPDASQRDGWVWNLDGVQRLPYRLPELLAADPNAIVWLPEGEKDCETLAKLGLVASCNSEGAGKWRPEISRFFKDRHCVILPDNDGPGRHHTAVVTRALRGVAASVRVLLLPGLEEKGDVTDWVAAGGTAEALLRLAELRGGNGHDHPEPEPTPEPPADDPQPRPRGRRARNTLALVTHILASDSWRGKLALNELTEVIEIGVEFEARSGRRALDDADVLEAMLAFQGAGFPKCSRGMALEAIRAVAARHAFHPIRNYLNGLQWDGVARVHTLFTNYLGADLPPKQPDRDRAVVYAEHAARCWMVSAVARVMQPGCKADHAPVLIGRQGMLKSTALRALCHDPAWFTDDISTNLLDRDTKESLRGKWIVELSEIPQLRRDADKVKAFFSRQSDRYREAYGLLNQDHARQCVFIGTSNELQFVDHTGNRRFWPVKLAGPIDIEAIQRDRDQLWAEAAALYCDGERWWLQPNVEALAAETQEEFAEGDLWEELIANWVGDNNDPFTLASMFRGIMPDRPPGLATKADQMRASQCLTRMGFVKVQRRGPDGRTRYWQKPSTT